MLGYSTQREKSVDEPPATHCFNDSLLWARIKASKLAKYYVAEVPHVGGKSESEDEVGSVGR